MRLRLRVCFPLVIVLGVLVARGQDAPSSNAQSSKIAEVRKPERKPDQVITNDPIARLAVRREPLRVMATPVAQTATAEDTTKKVEEIALVEQQIRDKQRKIAFLMRLFVDDERRFLSDPGNASVDPAVAERRRYEQDELRWETAELAKLKARRTEMTAAR